MRMDEEFFSRKSLASIGLKECIKVAYHCRLSKSARLYTYNSQTSDYN